MSFDAVFAKIKKLRRLATSDNANEAAAAAAAADRLIQEHRLSEAELTESNDEGQTAFEDEDPVDVSRYEIPIWRSLLLSGLCTLHGCMAFNAHSKYGHTAHVVGRPSDTAAVRFMFEWLALEVYRLSREQDMGDSLYDGNEWLEAYCQGAVTGALNAMKAEKRKVEDEYRGSSAMVLVDKRAEEAAEALRKKYAGLGNEAGNATGIDPEAFERGEEHGAKISRHRQLVKGK